jgi:hypothetical protein
MNNKIMMLLLLVVSYGFSQPVNDYKAVVIPMKYDFLKTENQYRLQTITKMNLQKAGFQAFYATETIPAEITDRCSILYVDVKKENAFLVSKLFIIFRDCYGTEVYKSSIGKSREKEYEVAYVEALNLAFESLYSLSYKYNGNTNFSSKAGVNALAVPVMAAPAIVSPNSAVPAVTMTTAAALAAIPVVAVPTTITESKTSDVKSSGLLYAQPTSYGYQLIDSEPKVIMKIYKTSNLASFMAKKGEVQGVLVAKENQWFFEYYQGDKLISEKIEVIF